MKKNTMMRLASFLLIAVLITTSAISGTYAKYVTQDSASDEARVAKWGISLQVVGDLYGTTYKDTVNDWTEDTLTVQAKDTAAADKNVVAPGTKNEDGFSFGLTGTPEVDYKIDATIVAQNIFLKQGKYALMVPVDAKTVTMDNFESLKSDLYTKTGDAFAAATVFENITYYTLEDEVDLNADYYPVVYAMNGTTTDVTSDINNNSLNEIAKEVAKKLNNGIAVDGDNSANATIYNYTITDATYNSNTAVNTAVALEDQKITWEWAFENGTDATEKAMYNGADTILGNLMAIRKGDIEGDVVKIDGTGIKAPVEKTHYCLDTQFSIDITVTQVN